MLQAASNVRPIMLDVCLHHHEKTDGSGYPERLKGDEISQFARMGAACDVNDAITANRPYKAGRARPNHGARWPNGPRGHFDHQVFQASVKSLGIYPIGSLVRLTSGRIGVVMEPTSKSLTTPCVKVFYSTKSSLRITPEIIDLSLPSCSDKIAGREDPEKWRLPDLNELWSGLPSGPW